MNKIYCSVDDRFVDPLFEVFDGGDFILSSYHDIESGDTELQIYFPEEEKIPEARAALESALEVVGVSAEVRYLSFPDEDWKLAYRRHFKTEAIGRRLLTVPSWEAEAAAANPEFANRIPIVLDPGMAFGTGKHETTRACLEYIDETMSQQSGEPVSFLDMGCGSGILSIAAAKLGCANVVGFDIDEEAVSAAKENAALNGVQVDYHVFALGKGAVSLDESIEAAKGVYPDLALQGKGVSAEGESAPFRPADLVVANILGPLLIAFADEIVGYAKSRLVISGILGEIYPEVLAAFQSRGFKEVSRKEVGEWTTGLLERVQPFSKKADDQS